MFSQPGTTDEKKLNWMYQGTNSVVDREDYLLGKSVDKSLKQLNIHEKSVEAGAIPKNHVEHECIPPSIRDYKRQQLEDQVDIQAKLQEDPLIAIKKREEESRKQFLQNPVQIAKLQKALRKREKNITKSKKHKLNVKLAKKIKKLTGNNIKLGDDGFNDETALDIILMHKFNSLRSLISEEALQKVLRGEASDSSSSDEDNTMKRRNRSSSRSSTSRDSSEGKHNHRKGKTYKHKSRSRLNSSSCKSNDAQCKTRYRKDKNQKLDRGLLELFNNTKKLNEEQEKHQPNEASTSRNHDFKKPLHFLKPMSYSRNRNDSDDEEISSKSKIPNYGLVRADGTKIELTHNNFENVQKAPKKEPAKTSLHSHKKEKLSEEEKDRRRREMLDNATWREKERDKNLRRYKEEDANESRESKKEFDKDFVHKELLKSVNSQTVESRIKANRNNLQRDSGSMSSNFSKR